MPGFRRSMAELVDIVVRLLYFLHLFNDLIINGSSVQQPPPPADTVAVRRCCLTLPSPLPPPPPRHRSTLTVKKLDFLNDCLMTVDGIDFRVPQKGTATNGNAFTFPKYAGKSALRYKLGMSILGGGPGVDPGSLLQVHGYQVIFWNRGRESRLSKGTSDTLTKSSVPRMWGIWRRSGRCRGGQGRITRC